jgi:hypothetical protein
MGALRIWVVILALVSFTAGGVGGLMLAPRGGSVYADAGHFSDYQRHFVEHFDLSRERADLLASLLRRYESEFESVRQRALERSMTDMEPELVRLGNRYRGIIRNNVLPLSQREEFTDFALAEPWSPVPESRP